VRKILIFLTVLFIGFSGMSFAAETNVPMTTTHDIGIAGTWTTENNRAALIGDMKNDAAGIQAGFQENFDVGEDGRITLQKDFVPIEAKVGRAFIGAMSMVGNVLDRSLFSFIRIFIIILFVFWIMIEAYNLMKTSGNARELGLDIVKKAALIIVWFIILNNNPAQLFMWIMSPVIAAGTIMSDIILGGVTAAIGVNLPDTCGPIHAYMAANPIAENVISSTAAADLLCIPTRLAGFFYICVAAGFKWILAGIGSSALTFAAGIVFVIIFVYNIWRFALQALGIVADMFLAILLLPFTAIAETFGKWKPKGDAPLVQIFSAFAGLFSNTQSLHSVFIKFINAIIYFVVLAVVAAIGLALLGTVVDANLALITPAENADDFMTILITGALVAYLVNKSGEIAKDLGGKLDGDSSKFTAQFTKDVQAILKNTQNQIKAWRKAMKK